MHIHTIKNMNMTKRLKRPVSVDNQQGLVQSSTAPWAMDVSLFSGIALVFFHKSSMVLTQKTGFGVEKSYFQEGHAIPMTFLSLPLARKQIPYPKGRRSVSCCMKRVGFVAEITAALRGT